MDKKKLYLIDGNSLLYRSYYAIKRLSTSSGFPTNAVFGFVNTLRKLISQEKPRYLGVVFDAKGPTVRHAAFKDYKAQRKPMPDDLVVQIPVLKKILKALNIPFFEVEKYEADDVLGTIASKASAKKIPSDIVSTDKDLLQLIDETTSVFNPVKEIHLDREKTKEIFGVYPAQIVDVLALWGDASDNIPGVPGIGEKTSKSLFAQFGSLDNLLKNLDKLENKRIKEKIEQNLDQLEISRKLVAIEKNLDLEFNLEEFQTSEPDQEELARLFKELNFLHCWLTT